MIRPLIGDGNLLVRTGIRAILTETFAITEVGEASSGAEVLENLRHHSWSLCILDVSLPERGGLEIVRYIRKGHRKTPQGSQHQPEVGEYLPLADPGKNAMYQ